MWNAPAPASCARSPRRRPHLFTGFAVALLALAAGPAAAAPKYNLVRWIPSPSAGVTHYVISIGPVTGGYVREINLGLPTAVNGVMERIVVTDDRNDSFLALRASNGTLYSQFSNEVVAPRGSSSSGSSGSGSTPPPGGGTTPPPSSGFEAAPFDPAHAIVGLIGDASGQISAVDLRGLVTPLIQYPNAGSEDLRPVWCDLNGDDVDDLLIGFGRGGRGELLILFAGNGVITSTKTLSIGTSYTSIDSSGATVPYVDENGETFPACGDVDGDGQNEIFAGLGPGSIRKLHAFDDYRMGFTPLWPPGVTLAVSYGGTRGRARSAVPALGDIDGDGRAEVVVGRSAGGDGRLAIFDDASTGFAPLRSDYDAPPASLGQLALDGFDPYTTDGAAYPSIGNLDGGNASEIVSGGGSGSAALLRGFDDASTGFGVYRLTSTVTTLQAGWLAYTQAQGGARPVLAEIDGDAAVELVVGFGPGGEGRLQIFDNSGGRFVVLPALSATQGVVDSQRNLRVAPAPRPW